MINLKEVITKYPECLESASKLRSYLVDLYPEEKARIRVIVDSFDCGIYEQIKGAELIDEFFINGLCKKLENEYGYSNALSIWCIEQWTKILNKDIAKFSSIIDNEKECFEATKTSEIFENNKVNIDNVNLYKDFDIENGVLRGIFHYNNKKIIIPEGVSIISEYAFRTHVRISDLIELSIPSSITMIENGAFNYLRDLKYNEFDNGLYLGNAHNPFVVFVKAKTPDITSCNIHNQTKIIYSEAFYHCRGIGSVNVPDGVIDIGSGAFSCCRNLRSITLPNSVKRLGFSLFNGCRKLTSIYYNGDKEQWQAIGTRHYLENNDVSFLCKVFCSDDTIYFK